MAPHIDSGGTTILKGTEAAKSLATSGQISAIGHLNREPTEET